MSGGFGTPESVEGFGRELVYDGMFHDPGHVALVAAPQGCTVLEGWFSYFVQGLLVIVTCCVLLFKWYREEPRREFRVFILDGSKQIIGAGCIHCLNLIGAITLEAYTSVGDQCSWYFLSIIIDTTFGVVVCYYLLQASVAFFQYNSGHYLSADGELDVKRWYVQVGHWCIIVTFMKAICVLVSVILQVPMHIFSDFVLHGLDGDHKLKLVVVMVLTPAVMNLFQFWMQDNFLKWRGRSSTLEKPGLRLGAEA